MSDWDKAMSEGMQLLGLVLIVVAFVLFLSAALPAIDWDGMAYDAGGLARSFMGGLEGSPND